MTTGFVYSLKPREVQEERYDVSTGVRRRRDHILGVVGLEVGGYVPPFLSIAAGLKAKTAKIVVRALVAETTGTPATRIKVARDPYIEDDITSGTGKNDAVVQSIDRTSADCDEAMLVAAFGAKVNTRDTPFEASAAGGTTPKVIANSALYENHKMTEGINSVALLIYAFEIEPEKLVMPFCAADKTNLPHFQFNKQEEKTRL